MPSVPSKGSPHHSTAPVLGEHFTLGKPSWSLCGVSSEAPFRLSKQGLSSAKTSEAARQKRARTTLPNAYLFTGAFLAIIRARRGLGGERGCLAFLPFPLPPLRPHHSKPP